MMNNDKGGSFFIQYMHNTDWRLCTAHAARYVCHLSILFL
jgi:hypothetical protein